MKKGQIAKVVVTLAVSAGAAAAQSAPLAPAPPAPPAAPPLPQLPTASDPYGIDTPTTPAAPAGTTSAPASASGASATASSGPPKDTGPKEPKAGDFDAGGQVRLPNGPDATGKFATYNWVAFDAKAKYYLLPTVTANVDAPVAIIHPDTLMDGSQPKMFGGFSARLEAKLPKMPNMPFVPKSDSDIGVVATVSYMHDGAMLLSEKDYPKFTGNFHPGVSLGVILKLKMSSLVDFSSTPVWVHQSSDMQPLDAVQIPASLILRVGSLAQVSADAGVFTGPDYSFSASAGGRIYAGGSLQLEIGPIVGHLGGGVASLLPGGEYPTIRDSVYLDVNIKYAK
jgi:hypothetical protein